MKNLLYTLFILPFCVFSQEKISGTISEDYDNKEVPLGGANVYWLNTSVGTVTDFDGNFEIDYKPEYKKMVISFVGYKTDTITVNSPKRISHSLKSTANLDEVTVTARQKASSRSFLQTQNVINVSSAELLKAACCNLAESFETNPSIDVNFADAISGTKQIKMLGLNSPYILITTENVPSIRGASQAYGLSFIPGTWVESIQITKGAGSVTNGYESIAGQINAELQKPLTDAKVFVNAYGSGDGRFELNTHLNTKVTDRWSTGLYIHGNLRESEFDKNDDSFLDAPIMQQVNVMNRWQYIDQDNGYVGFFNVRYLNDEKQTGQILFDPKTDRGTMNAWGSEIKTQRFDVSGKFGFVNPDIPWRTGGIQVAFSHHDQESYFGLNDYNIQHNSLFASLNYNSIIGDSRNKIKTGINVTYDDYDELAYTENYSRTENSVGAFFEYNFDNSDNLSYSLGLRGDLHNKLGAFITPRFHLRYTPWDKSAIRVSAGRGKRSANIFTENQNLFATSRSLNILGNGGEIYGLDPEIAWNYGISYMQGFNLFNKKADITVDFYRTDFVNQIVVDWENPSEISFYNLEGESFSNNFQAEFNYNVFERFDMRLAYKYYDVETDYLSGRKQNPLTPNHRFFANASYETKMTTKGGVWKFDATYNYVGEQRFASNETYLNTIGLSEFSPSLSTVNAQITKVFNSSFELYVGGENITNVKQQNPIVGSDNPFGTTFDTTYVYGPIFGSSYYAGLRYRLN
ncbi:outer membrane receptor for ferrienterochelin and colicins [Aequorivita sublithincola DSM 14238]|uniref:Outer membrane receptor for ferrienterochelin and colicins n=1 Tax=Aequorivita sublithincola (strain DSM 14238 / LMG 21431 / ACAM 643 / 9-3) TaxID=746697 RepID=I3YSU3_AEQSU|nr:TonB-dependent receptor [Aequorivita sublithincola]AFL80061.1 outer membrane receptor for ferrienterochelin and colicins [Aequorivita sublithincola DSM 14238]